MNLKCELCKHGDTYESFSEKLGITKRAVTNKMNGKNEWTLKELKKIKSMYNLSSDDIMDLFFAENVSQNETDGDFDEADS